MESKKWIIQNTKGFYYKESEFINQPREERWTKKLIDAMKFKLKSEAQQLISLSYLRDCNPIKYLTPTNNKQQ